MTKPKTERFPTTRYSPDAAPQCFGYWHASANACRGCAAQKLCKAATYRVFHTSKRARQAVRSSIKPPCYGVTFDLFDVCTSTCNFRKDCRKKSRKNFVNFREVIENRAPCFSNSDVFSSEKDSGCPDCSFALMCQEEISKRNDYRSDIGEAHKKGERHGYESGVEYFSSRVRSQIERARDDFEASRRDCIRVANSATEILDSRGFVAESRAFQYTVDALQIIAHELGIDLDSYSGGNSIRDKFPDWIKEGVQKLRNDRN